MDKFNEEAMKQVMMARLGGVSTATINRAITAKNKTPLYKKSSRDIRYSLEDTRDILSEFYSQRHPNSKKIISFYNFKGGTGKTSMCFQVCTHLALLGYRVLVVDTDPQGHLSISLRFNLEDNYLTLYDCLTGKVQLKDTIKQVYPGLDCIPSNLSLTRLEVELNQLPKREERLKLEFSSIEKDYDFILFDTNPTISHLNRNVLTYSQIINIVCETQPYSLNGLKMLFEDIERFYRNMQIKFGEIIVVPNKYEDRSTNSAEGMTVLKEYYDQYMKEDFAIRKSEDINNAAKLRKPLALFCKQNSIALEDTIDFINFLIERACHEKN